jgi:hypothetical protein
LLVEHIKLYYKLTMLLKIRQGKTSYKNFVAFHRSVTLTFFAEVDVMFKQIVCMMILVSATLQGQAAISRHPQVAAARLRARSRYQNGGDLVTMTGRISANGACQIHFDGKATPGVRAYGGSQMSDIRLFEDKCQIDYVVGELTDAAIIEDRLKAQDMVSKQSQSTLVSSEALPKVPNLKPRVILSGDAHTRQWVTDPANIIVNSTLASLSWLSDGEGTAWGASGGFANSYYDTSGWYISYIYSFTDGDNSNEVSAHYMVTFENDTFCNACCAGGYTVNDHNPTSTLGFGDGAFGWSIWCGFYGGCTYLLTHHWTSVCDDGSCYGDPGGFGSVKPPTQ